MMVLDGFIGDLNAAKGTVTVDGGTWANAGLSVGTQGDGAVTIENGGSVFSTDGYVARYGGSTGSLTVTGEDSAWQSSGHLCVGGTETADGGDALIDLSDGGRIYVGDIDPATVTSLPPDYTAVVASDGSGSGGEFLLRNGGILTSDGYVVLGHTAGETGAATVTGAGSLWTNTWQVKVGHAGEGVLTVQNGGGLISATGTIGAEPGSTGRATVDGGTWTGLGHLYVGAQGQGTLAVAGGGSVVSEHGYVGRCIGSSGTVTLDDGTWTIPATLDIGGSEYTEPGGTGVVTVLPGGLLEVGDALLLWLDGTLRLAGGTVRFGVAAPLDDHGGALDYLAGTVEFDCDVTVLEGLSSVTDFFGSPTTIPFGKHLAVAGQATLGQPLTLSGGTLSVGSIVSGALLDFQGGTFNLTASDLLVGDGGQLGHTLGLGSGMAVNVTQTATVAPGAVLHVADGAFSAGTLVNQGLVELASSTSRLGGAALTNESILRGTGLIAAPLSNGVTGEVQVASGEAMVFIGTGNTNAGEIQVIGGEVEFTEGLTNVASTGLISGSDATFRFGTGLTNDGGLGLTAGASHLFGDIANQVSGQVTLSGGGTATFYDDLANNGTVQVSAGCIAVFYGAVSGGGAFTGTGTVYLEGDLRPGASSGTMPFGGDVVFGPSAVLEAELGGTAPGAYDAVHVAGAATLGGTLAVDCIAPYRPSHNDTFQIVTFATRGGTTFDAHEGLDLGNRLTLVSLYGDTDLTLVAVQGGSGEWAIDADGEASVPTNWSAGLPNGVDDSARFGPVITAPREVTIDVPTTLGEIVFDSDEAYSLTGPNPLTFETGTGAAAITVADVVTTHTVGADVILADALEIDVATLGTLVFEGLLDSGAGLTLTKTGAGVFVINGPQDHAPGAVFEVLGGTLDMNTDASGTGLMTDADLSILVADATVNFGCDQHLDTLTIGEGGLVRLTGANIVVVKNLVMSGVPLGPTTLTPEPATLALLAVGGLSILARRRRRQAV